MPPYCGLLTMKFSRNKPDLIAEPVTAAIPLGKSGSAQLPSPPLVQVPSAGRTGLHVVERIDRTGQSHPVSVRQVRVEVALYRTAVPCNWVTPSIGPNVPVPQGLLPPTEDGAQRLTPLNMELNSADSPPVRMLANSAAKPLYNTSAELNCEKVEYCFTARVPMYVVVKVKLRETCRS